jgi:hypothetical protein
LGQQWWHSAWLLRHRRPWSTRHFQLMPSSILVDLIGLGHIQYKRAVLASSPRLTFRFRLPWAGVFQLLLNSLPRRMRSTFFLLAQTSHSRALIR